MIATHKRTLLFMTVLLLGLLALSYPWSKAAFAYSFTSKSCPMDLVQKAKTRLTPLFGEVIARPLLNCTTQTKFHSPAPGYTLFIPVLPHIITLHRHGLNQDVIAHEYSHSELATRLGYLPRLLHIPIWFDEGLAMQVDHRPDYAQETLAGYLADSSIKHNRLQTISTIKGFFRKGIQGKYHYALSRCVIKYWLKDKGTKQPLQLIKQTTIFSHFPAQDFLPYEKKCLNLRNNTL